MKNLFLICVLFLPLFLVGQLIHIPADYPTIQQGIHAASDTDTILVQPGTYLENINFSGKNIIVASLFLTTEDTSYISNTIIDANQNGTVVAFEGGESQSAVLTGFTISHGFSLTSGGGISCIYSSPSLENLIITENEAAYNGGGIICGASANPHFENVVFSNNIAGSDGGGIYCFNFSSPSLVNVTITNNSSAYHGGGICCLQNSSPSLQQVTISENTSNQGGGILCAMNSNIDLSVVHIIENVAIEGGGIFMSENSPTFSQLILSNNTATRGGGIFCDNLSSLNLNQSTISNNNATHRGAGIHSFNSSLYIDSCYLTQNEILGGQGGAIYFNVGGEVVELPDVVIRNTSISNNIGAESGTSAGAIFLKPEEYPPFDIAIENCTFEANIGRNNSGLRITGFELGFSIVNCSFIGNTAEQYAAAAAFTSGCSGEIVNCLFAANMANTSGEEWNSGALSIWNQVELDIFNCTFVDNSAFYGAALTAFASDLIMLNSIVWNNDNNDISLLDADETGSSLLVAYCDIQNGESGVELGEYSVLSWEEGNVDLDPLFVSGGDYPFQVSAYSPCVDAGTTDTSGLNLPVYDLSGEIRIFNERVDMGAYEWNTFVGVEKRVFENEKLKIKSYPNPFIATTTLSYYLHHHETVQISIYNHLGKQVDFIQQELSQGAQQITWNAIGQPSGMYFYQLQSEGQMLSGKMIKIN